MYAGLSFCLILGARWCLQLVHSAAACAKDHGLLVFGNKLQRTNVEASLKFCMLYKQFFHVLRHVPL